jgi:hypothetical protein
MVESGPEMHAKPLTELVQELSPTAQETLRDFAEFLLARKQPKTEHTLRQNWAGAVRAYRRQYTSLDLQSLALDWRAPS